MPNTVFLSLAALMVFAAIAMVVIPLLRRGDPSPLAAGAVVALLPLGVALLYLSYSNWQWGDTAGGVPAAQQAHNEQAASLLEVAEQLEQRLKTNPDDAEGWQMLGRTYVVLSRYPDAVDAYAAARELTTDQDVNAITGYAESLALMRDGAMDDEIAELFEKALLLSPDDRKGLWYGGLAAFEQGRVELARSRWQRLLALNPPEQMAVVLRDQIAAADAALGDTPDAMVTEATSAAAAPIVNEEASEAVNETAGAPEAADGTLVLSVSIASELAGGVNPNAPLFILAREAGVAGPPLAVVRRSAGDLPVEIVLTDDNSMMAGRELSSFESVEVVARISLGGTPMAQAGDLSGSKTVSTTGNVAIVIDSVVGD